MIKLTLAGQSEPNTMYVAPDHIATFSLQIDGTTYIQLKDTNGWHVVENPEMINAQMLAWQHRVIP